MLIVSCLLLLVGPSDVPIGVYPFFRRTEKVEQNRDFFVLFEYFNKINFYIVIE